MSLAALLLLAGFAGCRSAAPSGGGGPPPSVASEAEALLLLMVDRQLFDPFTVRRLAAGPAAERAGLALALGRVGVARGRLPLEILLEDPDPQVRIRAAFSLGQLGDAKAALALLRAARRADSGTGRVAVDSLARLGVSLRQVVEAVAGLDETDRRRRLLPSLFRFPAEAIPSVAVPALAVASDERRWAAYALARKPLRRSVGQLRSLLDDPDPWLRGRGARALGTVGAAADLARLEPLLDDPVPGPAIEALRAGRELIESGRAAPSPAWRAGVARRLDDARPALRLTAVEASAAVLPDPWIGSVLTERARRGVGRERELALEALASAGHPEAVELARRAAVDPGASMRTAAARSAAALGASELLATLAADREPEVRLAVLAARLGTPEAEEFARAALADRDPAVRAAALAWLSLTPVAPLAELVEATGPPGVWRLPELGLNGARAIAARGRSEPREGAAAVAWLKELAVATELPLRREAARLLASLGQPRPPVGTVDTGRSIGDYRDLARQAAADPEVELLTRHGPLRLRLFCSTAPLTCVNFRQLAAQGFYDGLLFHRVVPGVVIQGGDPRGDGWGGPGYTVRSENSLVRFERGTVGMALSEPDTGGSQFFITLSDQPHLDGSYPVLGRVVGGGEILDLIVEGDRIETVRELQVGSIRP